MLQPEEVVAKLKEILYLQSQLDYLDAKRTTDEKNLMEKYQVNACNKERDELTNLYRDARLIIQGNMQDIQKLIRETVEKS